jgi:hypothetical protein
LGESTSFDLLVAVLTALVFLGVILLTRAYGTVDAALINGELFLRAIIMAGAIYLVYETFRNWSLTQRASQGIVTIGYALFIIEQLGFILALANFGAVAVFLAYEGRMVALFLLNAVLIVGVKRDDSIAAMRRLGLSGPAHSRPTLLPN